MLAQDPRVNTFLTSGLEEPGERRGGLLDEIEDKDVEAIHAIFRYLAAPHSSRSE